ncbi:MAG: site-specific integrase [Humidesulfovibrio sp.]|nr:site-specific integrase [Humidesulfovibrio sp.]
MHIPAYLTLSRHSIYFFRYPLPKSVHSPGVTKDIKLSLHTRDSKRALQTARLLAYVGDIMVNKATQSGMSYAEIRSVLHQHFSTLLRKHGDRIASQGQLDTLRAQALSAGRDLGFAIEEEEEIATTKEFIAKHKLPISEGTPEFATFRKEFDKAYRAYCAKALAVNAEYDGYTFEAIETHPIKAESSPCTAITLSDLADRYVQERVKGGNWTDKTEREYKAMFTRLTAILGDERDCRALTVVDGRKVKEVLGSSNKSNVRKAIDAKETTHKAASFYSDTLHAKTVNKHLATYGSLFKWATANGYATANIFEGLTIKVAKKSEHVRTAFSPEQISRMVSELTENTSGLVRKDYQKWGPLLGIFTGARLNEIAQLTPDDVRQIDGIWCFDINEQEEGKHLKNKASSRIVPVHSKLISFGLLDYVTAMKKTGRGRLLHELTYDQNNGYGRNLGRWFNDKFLGKLGLKDTQHVFHSLRHTMVTELKHANVQDAMLKAIIGHAQVGVAENHYFGKGYKPEQLSNAIELTHINPL